MAKRNIKVIVGLFDVHLDDEGSSKTYKVVKKFLSEFQPDEIVVGGDFMDVSALSHWNESKRMLMEGKRFKKEVKVANKELDFLEKCTGELTYLEGNHERWIAQYVEKHPEMEGIIELPSVLNFASRNITFYELGELYKTGHLYWTHGMYTAILHAKKHLLTIGGNVLYGHTHSPQSHSMTMKLQDPINAWGVGCLCNRAAEYMRNKHGNWRDQFPIVYLKSDGTFNVYLVDIINNKFIWSGREYS